MGVRVMVSVRLRVYVRVRVRMHVMVQTHMGMRVHVPVHVRVHLHMDVPAVRRAQTQGWRFVGPEPSESVHVGGVPRNTSTKHCRYIRYICIVSRYMYSGVDTG